MTPKPIDVEMLKEWLKEHCFPHDVEYRRVISMLDAYGKLLFEIEDAPVVYGCNELSPEDVLWTMEKLNGDTHRAKLVRITEIKK